MTYSPDGKYLSTADGDTIHIWKAADGRQLRSVPVTNCVFFALQYSPDGQTLYAAATAGGLTRLCRIDPAGKVIDSRHILTGNANGRFSPDASWLAIRDHTGDHLRVIDTATGLVAWADRIDNEQFTGLAWSRDSKALVGAVTAGRLRVYEPKSGKVLHEHRLEYGLIWSMAFSADDKELVAEVGNPGHVIRLETATGEIRWKHATHRANELTFSADGKRVFYFGTAGTAREAGRWHFLDAKTGKPDRILDAGYGHAVAVRPDRKVLALGGIDGLIAQYDLTTHERLDDASADPPAAVTRLQFSPDGSRVRGWARGWYEWNVKTGIQTRLSPKLDLGATEPMVVSDDQMWLGRFMQAGVQSQFALIDLRTGQTKHTLSGIGRDDSLRFLPDGRLLAIGKAALTVFDPATGRQQFEIATGPGHTAVVSSDRRFAAVVAPIGDVAGVTLWDLTTGKEASKWAGTIPQQGVLEEARAWDGGLSADGRLVMVQFVHARNQSIRNTRFGVFDARTGGLRSAWTQNYWMRPSFSPDNRTAACRVPGPTGIEIREVITGERRSSLFNPRHVDDCVFAPDGRTLAIATRPGPVEIWNVSRVAGERDERWDPAAAERSWTSLTLRGGDVLFRSIAYLQNHAAEATPFLRERMKVPAGPTAEWVAARIKALDASAYRDRERATADLAGAAVLIENQLREALRTASPEARERLKSLIAKAEIMTPEKLRWVRACEVLERIGTPEAQKLLAEWAKGSPGALLTREAADSLERLKRHQR